MHASRSVGRISTFFRSLHRTLDDIGLYRLIVIVIGLVFLGALGIWAVEPTKVSGPVDAVWWSIVTLTTVGYGDISPETVGGRIVGAVIMLTGIGVLGAFTGQLASLLTQRRRLRDQGLLVNDTFADHIIFSGWSPRAQAVLSTMRSDPRGADRQIVLIEELDASPVRDDDYFAFIQGRTTEETLEKADLANADTIIVFGDPSLGEEARDAKVVLHLLTAESMNRDVHSIAEVELRSSIAHCRRAHTDEIIVGSEFTSHLMSRASLDHNISNILSEMMNPRAGVEIFKVPMSEALVGETFGTVLQRVKEEHDVLVIGIEEEAGDGGAHVRANPAMNRRLNASDTLIVIGQDGVSDLDESDVASVA